MGRVTDLLESDDGKIRFVKVKRPDRSEAVYPIKHLYPLELNLLSDIVLGDEEREDVPRSSNLRSRLPRLAAEKCLQRMKDCN